MAETDKDDTVPNDAVTMFRELLRSPIHTGAIGPSSRRLAEALTVSVPESGEPVVVELGPGTGPSTAVIQRRLGGRGRHIAVEINPRFAEVVSGRFPDVEVAVADARDLRRILDDHGVDRADAIVSGLPWSVFPDRAQNAILAAITRTLAPAGAFTTFTYSYARAMASAARFRRRLDRAFEEVVPGRTVWANVPPALVYHARRPRDPARAGDQG